MDRLSVSEAAAVLGVTQAAIYKRIQRGTIIHDKDSEGRVFVYMDASDMPSDRSMDSSDTSTDKGADRSTDASMDMSYSAAALIAELRAHNDHLLKELEDWKEEARRKDTILMTMAQRIPELEPAGEAPPEPREEPETSSPEMEGVETPLAAEKPVSWWRRIFFGD